MKEEPVVTSTPDPIYRHEYDWDYLNHNQGLYTYESDEYTSMIGVDVSYVQKDINWNKLKEQGIEFAFIRVGYRGYTEGLLHEDDYFRKNMEGAKEAGIDVGVYFFSQAITVEEAEEEAAFVLNCIKDYQLKYPVAYDLELTNSTDRIANLSQKEMTDHALAFVHKIEEAGYQTLVYGSSNWLRTMYRITELQDETKFWMAAYNESKPAYVYSFDIWQYTSNAYLDGINGPVDLDLWIVKK